MRQEIRGFWKAVASAGPYANNLHLAACSRHQHFITQFFTGRMLFLAPNQQCQSTEGSPKQLVNIYHRKESIHIYICTNYVFSAASTGIPSLLLVFHHPLYTCRRSPENVISASISCCKWTRATRCLTRIVLHIDSVRRSV